MILPAPIPDSSASGLLDFWTSGIKALSVSSKIELVRNDEFSTRK
jgi:hypothetical protein